MRYYVTVEGEKKEAEIVETVKGYRVRLNDEWIDLDAVFLADGLFLSILAGADSHTIETSRGDQAGHWISRVQGRYLDVTVRNELEERAAERRAVARATGPSVLRSPMPGLVIQLKIAVGDRVEEGTPVAILEAMKMQNELAAETEGRISEIHVEPGDHVEARAPIVTIEPEKKEP